MKEYIFSFVILFLLGCLFIAGIDSLRQFSEIDFCLDRGNCWDSIRQRCETEHQGYCVKNAQDCSSLFKGVWDDEKMFCEIPSL